MLLLFIIIILIGVSLSVGKSNDRKRRQAVEDKLDRGQKITGWDRIANPSVAGDPRLAYDIHENRTKAGKALSKELRELEHEYKERFNMQPNLKHSPYLDDAELDRKNMYQDAEQNIAGLKKALNK